MSLVVRDLVSGQAEPGSRVLTAPGRYQSPLYRQLPAYSPLFLGSIRRSVRAAFFDRADPRDRLVRILTRDFGARDVGLHSSGTHALQRAMERALSVVGGEMVALPAFSCFDLATAAVGAGADVALYDVEPETLSPDLDSVRRILQGGARVVVVSPLYGLPLDWSALEACVAPYGAILIEDAAQGHGAWWRGRRTGSFGELSVLSFGRGKGWTGMRGGGLLFRGLGRGSEPGPPARRVLGELKVVASALAQWLLGRPSCYRLPASVPWLGLGETRYRDPAPPCSLSRAAAALLLALREAADSEAAARRANAAAGLELLADCRSVRPIHPHPEAVPGYLRLPVRAARGLAGFRSVKRAIRLGVAPSYPKTLAELAPLRARLRPIFSRWPGARELSRRLITLPTHSRTTVGEQLQLLQLFRDYEP